MDINEIISTGISLKRVEPRIYSVIEGDQSALYDRWGGVYEAVACNRVYNRLVWGYRTSEFHSVCIDALRSSDGWVLDAGCGTLAFSARAYLEHTGRPVVLSDRSMWMLRAAKKRLLKLNGSVPDNMVFLHADAMQLPLKDKCIDTLIAMNLLHAVTDAQRMTGEFGRVLSDNGGIIFTTLVRNNRFADSYLHRLARGGATWAS